MSDKGVFALLLCLGYTVCRHTIGKGGIHSDERRMNIVGRNFNNLTYTGDIILLAEITMT